MPIAVNETITSFPVFEHEHLLDKPVYGDFRDELVIKGYTVIKSAVPRERALAYRDCFYEWLEGFPYGFKRDDPSTWTNECLPAHMKGGMFYSNGIAHEDFAWSLRTEPGILKAFADFWGTDQLTTSMDAACLMLPGRKDVRDSGKWEHMDQSQYRKGFYCLQGIANLNENGPEDGGLMVLENSNRLVERFFELHGHRPSGSWGPPDWFGFSDADQQWFYEQGCKWVKVCAEPGDLILWDSRAMHYNVPPTGDRDRTCTYICMAPANLLSEENRALKTEALKDMRGTSHVPVGFVYSAPHKPSMRNGEPDPLDTGKPRNPPAITDQIKKLAGAMPY